MKLKLTTQQPLNSKDIRLIDMGGKFHFGINGLNVQADASCQRSYRDLKFGLGLPLLCINNLHMRAAKTLGRLCACAGSLDPSLYADAINSKNLKFWLILTF